MKEGIQCIQLTPQYCSNNAFVRRTHLPPTNAKLVLRKLLEISFCFSFIYENLPLVQILKNRFIIKILKPNNIDEHLKFKHIQSIKLKGRKIREDAIDLQAEAK